MISAVEEAAAQDNGHLAKLRAEIAQKIGDRKVPVIGITGTGGAGKSSLTDELILRILHDIDDIHVAIISSDPSRRKTGGALLGDRIRMNAINSPGSTCARWRHENPMRRFPTICLTPSM